MTRPLYGAGPATRTGCMGPPLQRQPTMRPGSERLGEAAVGRCGVYSTSMATMATSGCSVPAGGRRGSGCTASCPVSASHKIAQKLECEYPTNTVKDSQGKLDTIIAAIERHLLHAQPSGNVKIASRKLHIGECPEVPENTETFAINRCGNLRWRDMPAEAAERERRLQEQEEEERRLRAEASMSHHTQSAPHLASWCEEASEGPMDAQIGRPLERACVSVCSGLAEYSTPADPSPSHSISTGSGQRVGGEGMRRVFSWHRLMAKLLR